VIGRVFGLRLYLVTVLVNFGTAFSLPIQSISSPAPISVLLLHRQSPLITTSCTVRANSTIALDLTQCLAQSPQIDDLYQNSERLSARSIAAIAIVVVALVLARAIMVIRFVRPCEESESSDLFSITQ
jgi:hypothetical protein